MTRPPTRGPWTSIIADRGLLPADGDVGEIVLDAPPLNLFGPAMFDDLEAAIAEVQADRPRALIFRAEGDVFSRRRRRARVRRARRRRRRRAHRAAAALTHAVEDLPLPTLAVVHGLCLTAGARAVARV